MTACPFTVGMAVIVTRGGKLGSYPATVKASKRDRFGWDVLVDPDAPDMELRWVGSDQLSRA